MTQLPVDVQLLIFSFLLQEDKLECMTVCRSWHDAIQRYSLFNVIYIDRQEHLDQLVEKVSNNPILGEKVEQLTLELMFPPGYDTTIFVDLFPNLRDFVLLNKRDGHVIRPGAIKARQNHPWCGPLRRIIENESDLITRTLLLSGSCSNLTSITVTKTVEGSAHDFIASLINAPSLKELHLNRYRLTFLDLELLHTTVPLLESLVLKNVILAFSTLPRNIQPATSIKSFRYFSGDREDFDDFNPHIPYISQKYTHVEELEIDFEELDFDNRGIVPLPEQKAMIASYFRTLGPRLKTLSVTSGRFGGDDDSSGFDFNLLSECGCQIENLELGIGVEMTWVERLSMSAQANFIKTLTVHNIYAYDFSPTIEFDWLLSFKKLRELSLEFSDQCENTEDSPMNLTDMLVKLEENRLETLKLSGVNLRFDSDLTTSFVYPWLKELCLSDVQLSVGADLFISRTFPNLKRLKLEDCLNPSGTTFRLPDTSLSYLEIVFKDKNEDFPILMTTLGDGQSRLYYSRIKAYLLTSYRYEAQKDTTRFNHVSSVPFDKVTVTPLITFVCQSVSNFSMTFRGIANMND